MEQNLHQAMRKKPGFFPVHISLRYKLTFPVLVFVSLMLFLLFQTTFQLLRELVMQRTEQRLEAMTEIFAEIIKLPMLEGKEKALMPHIRWMAERPSVLEVQVEDTAATVLGRAHPSMVLPPSLNQRPFFGVRRVAKDTYAAAVPIDYQERHLGRLLILYTQHGFEEDLRQIFQERLLLAFIMLAVLGIITTGITWLAIRPLFNLKQTVEQILAGDLSARASTGSFDEIADLANAFNEMVSRLEGSFERLRSRTEALKESEEKYRMVVESASDIIFVLTPEGELTYLNNSFFGCSPEELMKGGYGLLLRLHSHATRKGFEDAIKTVREKKISVMNVPMAQIDATADTEKFYLANLTPILDLQGSVNLIQGVMRDVTEIRRIEMMKESLIRDVAHELKTPVAKFQMVMNWLETEFEQKQEKEKYHDLLQILKGNADHLMRTISNIMDLSKLEGGMERIAKVPVDLNEVLSQVFIDMESMILEKKLSFECSFSPEPLMMKGDKNMLYRLFTNLVANAFNFTDAGKVMLSSYKKDGQIRVEISDTGIGIEKADLEIIFEAFIQKTASTKGIGVGLTICRNIAQLHGGRIWAESAGLGKGSMFKVEFPAA